MGRMVVCAFGYRLGFEWQSSEGREVVEGVLLPDWERLENGEVDHWFRLDDKDCLYDGEQLYAQGGDLRLKLQQLVQMRLTAEAREFLFVHAGVVGWRGQALVVPGPSRAGKSTLVLELVGAGAQFFSDEFAVFDRAGRVHAYPRPLWQRLSKTRKQSYTPEQLGWRPGPPLPAGMLLITQYVAGAHWQPRELNVESSLDEIWKEVRYPSCRPGARDWLRAALSGARCLKGARGEVSGMLPGLLTQV
ncbi:MAG: hypothetical protein KF760_29135 [Candidatus Eremiobacteraeota bacterium]|nr:hypothetical protein [Candidatus Eremiobacteraeota bacterium]MCW5865962.1 hypothetical protein [Candidatus Eremiobacteraeota bacterium]